MGAIQSQELIKAMQDQLNYERLSADVYYGLAVQLDYLNLTGMKAYMEKRAGEEREHARKFSDYLADRDAAPVLLPLPDPMRAIPADLMRAGMAAFSLALVHEQTVTARINALYNLALEQDDPQTMEFLHWFIHEQVEEERSLEEIITKFKLAGDNSAAVLMINEELGR